MRIFIFLLLVVSLSYAQWGGGGKSLNDYKKVSVSGRDIHVYAPSGLADNSPLLLSLHGMDQDPKYQQENTHWEAVADTAGFVVVYPRGGTGFSTWDISGDKDTQWILQIIEQMVKDYKIDPKRVYLSGFSMGGMFTYHAMGKIADKIAAYAPCSGYLMGGPGKAMRPVPIFHSHGTNDGVVGYDGLENNLKSYRQQFNCPAQASVQENYPHEGGSATLYTWGPCDDGVYVKHLKLFNRDHNPAKTEVSDIWNFVKNYSLDGAASSIEIPTDRDSVFNGSFSDSLKLAGWTLNNHSGEGSLTFSDGKAEIKVVKVGTNAYDIQMIQNGIHFEKEQSYKLAFDAYASLSRSLEVNVEKDTNPWTSYLGEAKSFDLGTVPKKYEITFTMKEATDNNGRVSFNAGLATGSVFIDNVVLLKVESSGEIGFFKKGLRLNAESTYRVYNIDGTLVCNLKSSSMRGVQARMKMMNLKKGLYVVKKGQSSEVVFVK